MRNAVKIKGFGVGVDWQYASEILQEDVDSKYWLDESELTFSID